ncbi:uracil-DNA glycosylase [Aureispira anguillae]|uniref:Uracil-DNA glycosylase n=1 Tax=Aureispira anguillae TaxID=2864201 RepID=A0A916DQ53_9BACT|nr:uracil-DNA glycosylase [Aureispira anguillae]BDS09895.1 uracil-DNA glycosylase [Aureispira anguillae]
MAEIIDVKIEESWKKALNNEFQEDYFSKIKTFLKGEYAAGKTIYPPGNLIFNAFDTVPLPELKVVILGQDPYHGPGQAHGLSFSVPKTAKIPPSLRNVYKELTEDIPGFEKPKHGNLETWAKQGVFLLNAFLTVEHKKAGSHQKIGWGKFTDAVIQKISDEREGVVFMFWGNFAKKKAVLVDSNKHLILEAAHPSPLAGTAFLGNKHFSQANAYLEQQGKKGIDWILPLD